MMRNLTPLSSGSRTRRKGLWRKSAPRGLTTEKRFSCPTVRASLSPSQTQMTSFSSVATPTPTYSWEKDIGHDIKVQESIKLHFCISSSQGCTCSMVLLARSHHRKQIYPAGSSQVQINIKLKLLHGALKTFGFGFLCMQLLTASSVWTRSALLVQPAQETSKKDWATAVWWGKMSWFKNTGITRKGKNKRVPYCSDISKAD